MDRFSLTYLAKMKKFYKGKVVMISRPEDGDINISRRDSSKVIFDIEQKKGQVVHMDFHYKTTSALDLVPLHLGILNQKVEYSTYHNYEGKSITDLKILKILSGPLKGKEYRDLHVY